MRIGFDLDEVVVDLFDPLIELTNSNFNLKLSKESFHIYNFEKNIYSDNAELNNMISDFLIYYANDAKFQLEAKPYDKSVDTIRYLRELNYEVYFITSRPVENTEATESWLAKHYIPYDKLIVLGHGVEKGSVGKSNRLDFFLDDSIAHLESMWKHKRNWPIGLFVIDRPWNKYSDKFNRIYEWTEVRNMFSIGGQYAKSKMRSM
jgi:uncharacterized HAD superfamily protein